MQVSSIGAHNVRLREVRRALRAGTLTSDGWLVIEGPHVMDEALRSGLEVGEVFIREDAPLPAGIERVRRLGSGAFGRLGATREPQGPIALVRPRRYRLDDIIRNAGLVAVLSGLQDPGNVGTILRLGDAFGCAGCIAIEPTVAFYNDKVVRASAGSLFRLPHVRATDPRELATGLRSGGVSLVGTAPGGQMPIDRWDWSRPSAVFFGNEGQGLPETQQALCDTILSIPCPGPVESLNTASAAAIVFYEAARARH